MSESLPIGIRDGFGPDTVVGLREARDAAMHYQLLRGLTSGGHEDFVLRFASVADLVHADQTLWTLDALQRRLCWLDDERTEAVLRALRRSGWLELVGQEYRLTSDGLAVYSTLCRLSSLRTGRDDDLAMGVFDLEASTRLEEDTGPALRHLQHHLRRSIEDVEGAIKSQSELKVLEMREKLDRNLQWSRRARELLDEIDIDDDGGYRSSQRLGRDLSELHRWHSVMQRVLDDIGRHRVPLGATGLRPTDVSRFLAGLSIDELAALGGVGVAQPVWPLVFIMDNLLDVAEYELLTAVARDTRRIGWAEGEGASAEIGEPPASQGEIAFRSYERDVESLVIEGESVPLERLLLGGDFSRTCYRMTLLALEDEREDGRLSVEVEPGVGRKLYSDFASEISQGRVIPRVPLEVAEA